MNFESENKELRQYDIAKMQNAIARERERLNTNTLMDRVINAIIVLQLTMRRRTH